MFDGWLLRLLPGQAKRARSINAVYPSRRALADKVGYCEALYKRHHLPAVFRITPFSEPPGLDAELERLGYPRFDTTAVEAAVIDPIQLEHTSAQPMELLPWVEEVGRLRGSNAVYRRSHLERLQSVLLPLRPMAVWHGGAVVATGLTIVEDGWAGLFDVVTDSGFRRQGFADQLVQGLLRSAWEMGARQSYLQVSADNRPARTLYARYGFQEQYQYWYRGHAD